MRIPARRRRRRRFVTLLPLALLVVVFGLGVAVGEALNDNPKPGGEQTLVRTLTPLPLVPAAATTTTAGP